MGELDSLTLREKLDKLEACEKLIEYYEADLVEARKEERAQSNEDVIGYDYISPVLAKLEYCKRFKKLIMSAIEKDPSFVPTDVPDQSAPKH